MNKAMPQLAAGRLRITILVCQSTGRERSEQRCIATKQRAGPSRKPTGESPSVFATPPPRHSFVGVRTGRTDQPLMPRPAQHSALTSDALSRGHTGIPKLNRLRAVREGSEIDVGKSRRAHTRDPQWRRCLSTSPSGSDTTDGRMTRWGCYQSQYEMLVHAYTACILRVRDVDRMGLSGRPLSTNAPPGTAGRRPLRQSRRRRCGQRVGPQEALIVVSRHQ